VSSAAHVHSSEETRARAVAESGWAYPVKFLQWGNPAFWVYVLLVGSGALLFYGTVQDSLNAYPTATVLSLVLITLYGLPFLWFLTRRDRYEREPAKLALIGFLWGGLAASWVMAAPGNTALLSIFAKVFGTDFALNWGAAIAAPLTEETAKWAGLILLFLLARNHVRSAYDGLILGAFSGLGFQLFENFQYLTNAAAANFGNHQCWISSRSSSCAA
jgi:RsiW-degrading membrane proteinase PrsW (M82 family)